MAFLPIVSSRLRRPALARKRSEAGSSIFEFALMMTIGVPLFFATVVVGVSLGRALQATQITRDLGHMYALGVDFTQARNTTIAKNLATGFDITAGGTSTIILSQVTKVYPADCAAANLGQACPNVNQTVFINRIVLGDGNARTSKFGTPPAGCVNAQGNIAANDNVNACKGYLRESSLIAHGFDSALALKPGEVAWVTEGLFAPSDLRALRAWGGYQGGLYARSIF